MPQLRGELRDCPLLRPFGDLGKKPGYFLVAEAGRIEIDSPGEVGIIAGLGIGFPNGLPLDPDRSSGRLPHSVPARTGQPISSVSSSSAATLSRVSQAALKRHSLSPATRTAIPKSERATRRRVRRAVVAIVFDAFIQARLTASSVFALTR